jgi:hypothetical protein
VRGFLLACIPGLGFVLGVELLIYSYVQEWPEFWASLGAYICLGAAYGSRGLLDD